jgi:hypothetical protein
VTAAPMSRGSESIGDLKPRKIYMVDGILRVEE